MKIDYLKTTLFTLFLLFMGSVASAQESIMTEINYPFLEKLIELAKHNYPKNKIQKLQEQQSKTALAAAKISYLDLVNLSYYYRPADRLALSPDNPFIFNGFQVGLTISPGIFLQKPSEVKQARMEYDIAKLQSKDFENILSNQVKSAYYLYISLLNDLKMKTEVYQDMNTLFEDVKFKYEKGEVDIETYSNSRIAASQANSDFNSTEMAFLNAQDALEELIGMKIAEVK